MYARKHMLLRPRAQKTKYLGRQTNVFEPWAQKKQYSFKKTYVFEAQCLETLIFMQEKQCF